MDQLMEIQKAIFQQIKGTIPSNCSFVHEISEVLGLSYDSAYRRIRGDKVLSFEELYKLSMYFKISIDTFCNVESSNIIFDSHRIEPDSFRVCHWLEFILENIRKIHDANEKVIIYSAKDPPIFHYFHFPEIAAFKTFFWEKTLYHFHDYNNKLFRLEDADPEIQKIGRQILALSTKVPTIEIWNEDTFNITLGQIEFYWISGYFEKKDDLLNLIDKLEKWILHTQKQAECGFKFIYGQPAEGIENSFQLYENELVMGDNTILARVDHTLRVYLTYNSLNLLTTTNEYFCNSVKKYLEQLITSSNLISHVGAMERNRFFNRLLNAVVRFKEKID